MAFYTYLMASGPYGTLYCGHTENLPTRVQHHQDGTYGGFTRKYRVHNLVWFEDHEDRYNAFRRERQIKKWNRAWKIRLIEEMNPLWMDLSVMLSA